MLNNFIQIGGQIETYTPTTLEQIIISAVAIILLLIIAAIPTAFITSLKALSNFKKHPRKEFKIYKVAAITTIIAQILFIIECISLLSSSLFVIILLIVQGILIYFYIKNKDNKKDKLKFQFIMNILPTLYILSIIINLISYFI